MVPLEEIFCFIDDFCKCFQQHHQERLLPNPNRKRNKTCQLTVAEIMTILVLFQLSHYCKWQRNTAPVDSGVEA